MYRIITSFEELPKFKPNIPVFADIETTGLYVGTRLVQLYQPGTNEDVIIVDIAPSIKDIPQAEVKQKELVELLKPLWLVFYNGSYDLGTLNFVPAKTDDLFYAVKTAYPHFMEFALDKETEKLPYTRGLYNGLDKKAMQKKGFARGAYLSKSQYRYSAIDVIALSKMWTDPKIQNVIQNNLAYKVDIISQEYAVQYQQNGLKVPQELVREEIFKADLDVNKLQAELPYGLNVNSPKQVKEYLGTKGASRDVLLRSTHTMAPTIMALKKRRKELSYLNSINYDEMVTKFNPAGAITGRFTSSGGDIVNGFNAQQIPHRFQYLFTQDTKDTTVIGLDYGTLELRVAASIWGIEKMHGFFLNKQDLHTEMAKVITGKKLKQGGVIKLKPEDWGTHISDEWITDEDRTHAKACNFGFVFGMSAATFMDYAFTSFGVRFTAAEAQEIRDKFFALYPEAAAVHRSVWKNYKKPAFYVSTALGRRIKPRMGTDGINIPVQGTGAETTKLAVHYLIKAHPEAIHYIFNVVHDSCYMRVPKAEKELWHKRLKTAMLKGWTEIQKTDMFKYKDIEMTVAE
ncbi:MAG: hypothetical protein DRN33_06320 [Thermoplasmata archaeon]|nr:MAG: hypothetical protein DRN33_06320 [Thermoplasmata archaeon]